MTEDNLIARIDESIFNVALRTIREKAGSHTIAAHPYYTKPTEDPSFGGIYAVADLALAPTPETEEKKG